MSQTIGISTAGPVSIGLVEENRVVASLSEGDPEGAPVLNLPMEALVEALAGMVQSLCIRCNADPVAAGICFPGIIRQGIIEESPNLKQAKGANLRKLLGQSLEARGMRARVSVCNDADAV